MAKARIRPKLRESVFKRDGFKCLWCGRSSADGVKLHADHVVPESFGGSTSYENLGTLCDQCNISKSNEYFGDYLLTTIFKVKDIDSKITSKKIRECESEINTVSQGCWRTGQIHEYSLYEFKISFFREINELYEPVYISHEYSIDKYLLDTAEQPDSEIRINDIKHKEMLEFKNKIRDYLFENKGFLEEINSRLIFRERK